MSYDAAKFKSAAKKKISAPLRSLRDSLPIAHLTSLITLPFFSSLITETLAKPGRGNVLVARAAANRGQRGRCPSHARGFASASAIYVAPAISSPFSHVNKHPSRCLFRWTGRAKEDKYSINRILNHSFQFIPLSQRA
jgi:hypothetical protein